MLRSFQYEEKLYMEYSLHNDLLRDKEIEMAYQFVASHPICRKMECKCPICGHENSQYFYTKWDVDYLRCDYCKSIFAMCDRTTVEQYQQYEKLRQFRLSQEYQEQIILRRKEVWQDFLEWIEVRSFRFMRRNRKLSVVDIGNWRKGYSEVIRDSALTGCYDLRESWTGQDTYNIAEGEADLVFYLDRMVGELDPEQKIRHFSRWLKKDGLLIINARAGSGFDIITLRENSRGIYPYEHIVLPSVRGLTYLLQRCGYEVLEVTTPGVMDVKYVMESRDKLDKRESFVQYLLEESTQPMLQEFQRFLQKSCLSSLVCVIARKDKEHADL